LDQLNYIINWIAKDIFGVPAYLVGIMTFVALVASRKGLGDVVGGTLKATLGFIILGIGAGADGLRERDQRQEGGGAGSRPPGWGWCEAPRR